jgi:hypothetical protein
MGDILDNMDDAAYNRLHDIHQAEQQQGSAVTVGNNTSSSSSSSSSSPVTTATACHLPHCPATPEMTTYSSPKLHYTISYPPDDV